MSQIADFHITREFGKGGFFLGLADICMSVDREETIWSFGQAYKIRKAIWKVSFI